MPYILDASGQEIGRLGAMFPFDPPAHTTLTLSDWHHGFPHHIDIHVENAAARGNYDAPSLQWDEKTKQYIQIGLGIRNQHR
ncbi:MAG: hypothetical protein P4L66_04685 [Acetobacteraceae bacterium]|nr:hypothetical protein [Acetobacteraceae bacterium]